MKLKFWQENINLVVIFNYSVEKTKGQTITIKGTGTTIKDIYQI